MLHADFGNEDVMIFFRRIKIDPEILSRKLLPSDNLVAFQIHGFNVSLVHMNALLSACCLQVLGYSHTVVEKSRADAESYPFCHRTEKCLPMIDLGRLGGGDAYSSITSPFTVSENPFKTILLRLPFSSETVLSPVNVQVLSSSSVTVTFPSPVIAPVN